MEYVAANISELRVIQFQQKVSENSIFSPVVQWSFSMRKSFSFFDRVVTEKRETNSLDRGSEK